MGRDCHKVFGVPFCGERCSFSKDSPEIMDNYEYTINSLNKNGEIKNIEMSFNRMDDENGKLFGVIAFLRDVTDILSLKIRAGKLNSFAGIIGKDTKMLQVFQQIRDVAGYNYPVHISGETGTGKELVAAAIHNESQRNGAPFIAINCGALPENLIESELFGTEILYSFQMMVDVLWLDHAAKIEDGAGCLRNQKKCYPGKRPICMV